MNSFFPQIFCQKARKIHLQKSFSLSPQTDPLVLEVESTLFSRISDFKNPFHSILTLGFRSSALTTFIKNLPQKTRYLTANPLAQTSSTQLVFEEEYFPFGAQKLDLILSALHLHNINDLPGSLLQIQSTLKHNGLFIGALLGGNSLKELRTAFLEAELFLKGGLSNRFHPALDMKDMASLLKRAGFKNIISESQLHTFFYNSPEEVCFHLKSLAETNILKDRPKGLTSPSLLKKAFEFYEKVDSCFPLTFEIIYLTAWR